MTNPTLTTFAAPRGGLGFPWRGPAGSLTERTRLAALVELLARHADYWRPSPFRTPHPAWADAQPSLVQALRALDDKEVAALTADTRAAQAWLLRWLPDLVELDALVDLPRAFSGDAAPAGGGLPRFAVLRDVPGRKAAQIEAFAQAVGVPRAPVFEACSGKGHLGRCMLAAHGGGATSLELDPRLCRDGETLAGRLRLDQHFVAGDIHDDAQAALFAGRHVVALHACGDLHRRVLDTAAASAAPAIDLAPCCYQKSAAEPYRAETQELASLGLDRNALQLAVTESVTASKREVSIAARQQAWKLAFVAWRERFDPAYRPFMPVPSAWWHEGFAGVFSRLCAREGRELAHDEDFTALEAEGWRRWRLVERLQLVRFAFRRAIEVALLSDLAVGLEGRGYAVRLAEFCPRELTPRNVLVSARLI